MISRLSNSAVLKYFCFLKVANLYKVELLLPKMEVGSKMNVRILKKLNIRFLKKQKSGEKLISIVYFNFALLKTGVSY